MSCGALLAISPSELRAVKRFTSGSKAIYGVSQPRDELHPPDGMGPRHGDEAREKEQHAKQAEAEDPHDDVIVAVATDRAKHRDRLACSLAQLNYYGVHHRNPDSVGAHHPGVNFQLDDSAFDDEAA